MKKIILLIMSLFSILLGCNRKKALPKVEEWPRFPLINQSEIKVTAIPLTDGFKVKSFYIDSDKQKIYVIGSRAPEKGSEQEIGKNRPGEPAYMDYQLLCLDANGQIKYQKDMLHTDWIYGGTFGILEGELLLRIGDWFLVLEPETFAIRKKIRVHDSIYLSWKETEMTRDEHQADYKAKFVALLETCKTCKCLYWPPSDEYMLLEKGETGEQSAWKPMPFEDKQLEDLKQGFELSSILLNPHALYGDSTNVEIKDALIYLREVEYLSAGTQLVYPNYQSRSVLQYELTINDIKIHFSTSDKDGHNLHLNFSDNLMLSMADESVWLVYESILYRVHTI